MAESLIETAVNLTEQERRHAAKNYPGPSEFVHHHNHTLFSPLDGIAHPNEYFSAAAHLGQSAFSITDHGSIAAVPDAYWAAKKHKVKFIPGCEIYFQQNHLELIRRRQDPDFKIKAIRPDYTKSTFGVVELSKEHEYSDLRRNRHLSVLAMNMVGYRNLIHMTTEAWEIGF
jgi:DNA polymerase-3 subunit alpha